MDIEAIKERCEAAEKGPWELGGCSGRMVKPTGYYPGDGFLADVDLLSNAAFIAHARTDVPELLRWVERARGYILNVSSYVCECSGCGEHECEHCALARQLLAELTDDAAGEG